MYYTFCASEIFSSDIHKYFNLFIRSILERGIYSKMPIAHAFFDIVLLESPYLPATHSRNYFHPPLYLSLSSFCVGVIRLPTPAVRVGVGGGGVVPTLFLMSSYLGPPTPSPPASIGSQKEE